MSLGHDSIAALPIATTPLQQLRIKSLSLCDFRAFPAPVLIQLNSKNLLVYGENGSGKSSIFYALQHFFSLKPPKIKDVKNIFTPDTDANFKVEVEFSHLFRILGQRHNIQLRQEVLTQEL